MPRTDCAFVIELRWLKHSSLPMLFFKLFKILQKVKYFFNIYSKFEHFAIFHSNICVRASAFRSCGVPKSDSALYRAGAAFHGH
jgi:hypothetical protein